MFSIIIPNYNRAKVISNAIDSVLRQTYTNFELIIVDDCSTDNSLKVISEYKDERINVFQMEINSGAAAARNFGINKSSGDFISFLDSDDYYEPEFLLETIKELESTSEDIGFMWTGVRYIENGGENEFSWSPYLLKTPYLTFLHSLHIGTNSGITVKKNVFEECGSFDIKLPAAEDTEFFLRITKKFNFKFTKKVLINIERDGEDRLSKNFIKIAKAYNLFLPHHFKVIDENPILKQKFYYKMMWLNYHLDDHKIADNFYNKIPKELRTYKIKFIKWLYEYLPLRNASYIHQKLSY